MCTDHQATSWLRRSSLDKHQFLDTYSLKSRQALRDSIMRRALEVHRLQAVFEAKESEVEE